MRCDRGRCWCAPPSTPTGEVSFVSNGAGVFTAGDTCELAPVSPGVASCSVQFLPPADEPPNLTATYVGDSQHAGSSSRSASIQPIQPPDPTDPSQCSAPAGPSSDHASGASVAAASNEPIAHMALNNMYASSSNPSLGDTAYYYFMTCVHVGTLAVGGGVTVLGVGLGGTIVAGGVLAPDPEPVSKTGLVVGSVALGTLVAGSGVYVGGQIINTANTAQNDPPDFNFRQIAKVTVRPFRRARLVTGESQALTNAFYSEIAQSYRVAGLAQATTTSINRAGGARERHNGLWEGRQARAAVAYADQLTRALDTLATLTAQVGKLAKRNPSLGHAFSAAVFARLTHDAAKGVLPHNLVLSLKRCGLGPPAITELARTIRTSKYASVPHSLAALFAGPSMIRVERDTAEFLHYFVSDPSVLAETRLK